MNSEKMQQLSYIYELETELFLAEKEEQVLSQKYAQAKYDQRLRRSDLVTYEGISLKGILDRIKGNREQQLEQYRKNLRNAEANMLQTQQELERLRQKQRQLKAQRDTLPAPEAIRDWIGEDTAGRKLWMQLDIRYCITRLDPLLEENLKALLAAQKVLRGDTLGEVLTFEEQQERLTGPDSWARECKTWLERIQAELKVLEIPFELEPYYQSPEAYLASATKYTRIDRFHQAIKQVEKTKKTLSGCMQHLQINQ